jgi:diketogulonate reductase-like aldo/keto reductase
VTNRAGVSSTIIGATKLSQLEDNIQSLEFTLSDDHLQRLDAASKPVLQYPYFFHQGELQDNVKATTKVNKFHSGFYR